MNVFPSPRNIHGRLNRNSSILVALIPPFPPPFPSVLSLQGLFSHFSAHHSNPPPQLPQPVPELDWSPHKGSVSVAAALIPRISPHSPWPPPVDSCILQNEIFGNGCSQRSVIYSNNGSICCTYPGDHEVQLVLLPGGDPCYPIYPISRDVNPSSRENFLKGLNI